MKKLLTILSIALLSTTAYAEDGVPTTAEMDAPEVESTDLNTKWKALDLDTDGTISKEEADADVDDASNWDAIDSSHDGKIDPQEFVRFFTKS